MYDNLLKFLFPSLLLFCLKTTASAQLFDVATLDTMQASTVLKEAMQNPEKVIKLKLRNKKLKKIPNEVFKLTNLQYLDLSKSNIKEIPEEIELLTHLQVLILSKNDIETLPKTIGNLKQLRVLNLSQNKLIALPPQIGMLENLEKMDLWSNNIEVFPLEFKNLKHLKTLDLRVIVINDKEQKRIETLLPDTKIYFSPGCKCAH